MNNLLCAVASNYYINSMGYIIGHIHYHMKATLNLTHSYGNIFFQVHHTAEETSLPPKEM